MAALRFSSLGHRGIIEVSGADRASFLQGLVSNDTTRVSTSHAEYAALLSPQGRFQYDMILVEKAGSDAFLLDVERDRAADLIKRLSMFKLRSKVTIASRLDDYDVIAAFGPDAARAFGLPATRGAVVQLDGAIVIVDPRLAELGLRILAPHGSAPALLASRGFAVATEDDYESMRLRLGVPDGSRDLPVDKAFLLENGFDELNGVDWNKGCYMGQELTARTRYRGLVRKRLLPVTVDGPMPAPGTPVMLGDRDAGDIRSGRAGRALALLRLELIGDAARTGASFTAGSAKLKPELPPWVKLPEPEQPVDA